MKTIGKCDFSDNVIFSSATANSNVQKTWREKIWYFLAYNPELRKWRLLDGIGAPYFWINHERNQMIFFWNNSLWIRKQSTDDRQLFTIDGPDQLIHLGCWSADDREFVASFTVNNPLGATQEYKTIIIDVSSAKYKTLPLTSSETVVDWSPSNNSLLTINRDYHGNKHLNEIDLLSSARRVFVGTYSCADACYFSSGNKIASTRGGTNNAKGGSDSPYKGAIWFSDKYDRDEVYFYGNEYYSFQEVNNFLDQSLVLKGMGRKSSSCRLDISKAVFGLLETDLVVWKPIDPPNGYKFPPQSRSM